MEQITKAPLEFHVKGYPFMGQELILPPSVPNTPHAISQEALLALPYISLIVGIDELVPTKAVYALYDPDTPGLRFVRGDGTFIPQQQICFHKAFKNSTAQCTTGRDYYVELVRRSANHRHMSMNPHFVADCNNAYPTVSTVKSALTYLGDLSPGSCPALKPCPAVPASEIENKSIPEYFSLAAPLQWDFDPGGFQAFTDDDALDAKYLAFSKRYRLNISPLDFQHALFCLAGLEKVGLISFTLVGCNDVRYFKKSLTPPIPPKLKTPTKTHRNWTIDCFLARFERYQTLFKSRDGRLLYERFPNPIAWLEAYMDYEVVSGNLQQPGYMDIEEDGYYMDESVISWQFLKGLKWETRGDYSQYPKPLFPLDQHPLYFHVENPEPPRSRKESKRTKQERRENRKAAKKAEKAEKARAKAAPSYMIDITDSGPGHHHMYSSGVRNTRELLNQQQALALNPRNAEISTTALLAEKERERKRKLAVYQTLADRSPNRVPITQTFDYSSDEEDFEFPTLEELRKRSRSESNPYPMLQKTKNDFSKLYDQPTSVRPESKAKFEEPKLDFFGNEDGGLYDVSDEERERAWKKKRERKFKRQRRENAAGPASRTSDEFFVPQSFSGGAKKKASEMTSSTESAYNARAKDVAKQIFSPTKSTQAFNGFLRSFPEEWARYAPEFKVRKPSMGLMDEGRRAIPSSSPSQTSQGFASEYQRNSDNQRLTTGQLKSPFHEDEDDLFGPPTPPHQSTPVQLSRSPASPKDEVAEDDGFVEIDEYNHYEEPPLRYPSPYQGSQPILELNQKGLAERDETSISLDAEYFTTARGQGSLSCSSATLPHLDDLAGSQDEIKDEAYAGQEFFSPSRVNGTD